VNTFILYSMLLLVVALLFILVPVLCYKPTEKAADSDIRKQKNIDVFQQSLADLQQDQAEGLISAEDFVRLKTELERSFLRDMEDEEQRHQTLTMKSGKVLPLLSLLFVPIFSFALYQVVGSARDLALPGILAELQTVETEAEQLALLTELADFLQARFERQEDDVQNGYMLGTLYLELDRYQDAIDTFRQLADGMDAGMDKATVLGQLAQSLFLQSESEMTPEIRNITDQALVMNPNEYAVMSLLAMDALLNEDIVGAVGYWRRQLLQVNAGSRDAAVLRDRITRAETMFPDLFEGDTAAPDGPSVTVIVDIDESVVDRVTDDMRLFVFARNPAMPAPLAAENLPLPASFPIEITLDNTKSMIAGMNLSTATDVIVGARLTRGGATAESGDIQALSDAFSLADQQGPVSLTIKDIVP